MNTDNQMTVEDYDRVETTLRQVKEMIDPIWRLALEKNAIRLRQDLGEIDHLVGSLAYMSHPQEEWLGGDSSDPKNFTRRLPHIHNSPIL